MYNPSKSKPKIDPMNMDFDSMIRNHPEFFTKLSTRDHVPERPPPASGGFSSFPKLPSVPDGFSRLPPLAGGGGSARGRRVGGLGATLKPKIFPPTLMRNAKPKGRRNNFFK
jgi:hypothetical protein